MIHFIFLYVFWQQMVDSLLLMSVEHVFSSTWDYIEVFPLWSMGFTQLEGTSICPFQVMKYGIHSTGGDIHLSILKRAIFHRGGTMESFIFKVWEAASAKIIHLSISCVLKYGKLPAQRSSISPFHWFGLPCFSLYDVIFFAYDVIESRGCRSRPTVPASNWTFQLEKETATPGFEPST